MDIKRIEYIEDGSWRDILEPVFKKGLERESIIVNAREDFTQLKQDLELGNLADVYILDNEIAGDHDRGAEMALKIHEKATEMDKEVLVITLLCSAPDKVKETHGGSLNEKGIPILSKLTDAGICGFFVGRCIREDKNLDFNAWIKSEGIQMPQNTPEGRGVQNAITIRMEKVEPGGFYLKPREFIEKYREGITRSMDSATIREMDRIFPTGGGLEHKG